MKITVKIQLHLPFSLSTLIGFLMMSFGKGC